MNDNKPHRTTPVGAGYLFALIVALILGSQMVDFRYSKSKGEEDILLATKQPGVAWVLSCTLLIGLGLGIEIDKSEIGKAVTEVVRRVLGNNNQGE